MATVERSLRRLVEKWLGPVDSARVSARQVPSRSPRPSRCVRVQADRPTGTVTLLVFRHPDGNWHVFPPQPARPAMNAWSVSA